MTKFTGHLTGKNINTLHSSNFFHDKINVAPSNKVLENSANKEHYFYSKLKCERVAELAQVFNSSR